MESWVCWFCQSMHCSHIYGQMSSLITESQWRFGRWLYNMNACLWHDALSASNYKNPIDWLHLIALWGIPFSMYTCLYCAFISIQLGIQWNSIQVRSKWTKWAKNRNHEGPFTVSRLVFFFNSITLWRMEIRYAMQMFRSCWMELWKGHNAVLVTFDSLMGNSFHWFYWLNSVISGSVLLLKQESKDYSWLEGRFITSISAWLRIRIWMKNVSFISAISINFLSFKIFIIKLPVHNNWKNFTAIGNMYASKTRRRRTSEEHTNGNSIMS